MSHRCVVPDVVCNAGSRQIAYFEWVQDMSGFFWSEEEINARMDGNRMTTTLSSMSGRKRLRNPVLCTAAYILSPVSAFCCWPVRSRYLSG
ncbi:hypothetical protein KCP75_06160 [Salmonella enterica subsp. enterica]|nr:hypothetical protein KCP75_06160 [Salmonella enterica subsp. enterica]